MLYMTVILLMGMWLAVVCYAGKIPGEVGTDMPVTMGVGTPVDGPNKPEVGAAIIRTEEPVGIGTENPAGAPHD